MSIVLGVQVVDSAFGRRKCDNLRANAFVRVNLEHQRVPNLRVDDVNLPYAFAVVGRVDHDKFAAEIWSDAHP